MKKEDVQKQMEFITKVKKINEGKNLNYYILTMGCQLNENDSEKICGMIENMGYSKTDDLSNYNYMNLSAKKYDIENGVLYFSYDGVKTYTVPGDFSNIESYEDDQYQISENMIVFYYKTTNGKYIVYSKDKGASWQTEKIPSGGNIKSIKFPNVDVGYILEFSDEVMSDACGAIYKTTNGGKSWDEVYTGVYNGHDSSFSTGTKMVFANENVGFITMPDIQGEVSDLYITKDGGVTFEKE